jgi:hypothetical protein
MKDIENRVSKGHFVKRICEICRKPFSYERVSILSCGHVFHEKCLLCSKRCFLCNEIPSVITVLNQHRLAAITIQRMYRGFSVRSQLRSFVPLGSLLHRKLLIRHAKEVSAVMIDAIERQSDTANAIVVWVTKQLESARTIRNAMEIREKVIDWKSLKWKILRNGCGKCLICLTDIIKTEAVITSCGHCFHEKCLREWMECCQKDGTVAICPVCRCPFQYCLLC